MCLSKKIEISVAIALIVSVALSIITFAKTSDDISNSVIRLHIIANSDSYADQQLKLKVRDELLTAGDEIFDGSVNVENAREKILPKIDLLEKTAERVIKSEGFDYDVSVSLKNEYFSTRTYKEVTLPAGNYLALKVVIGKGEGHNWWCVMFPPMCISAADESSVLSGVLNENELKLINKKPEFEPRFKIVELYEKIKQHIAENKF